uniref:Protein interacting with PRKCA 1 n=1 Tax=Leptobrachium leishanense TaxID=445787 RepID=A0A8C5WG08_9ANUR
MAAGRCWLSLFTMAPYTNQQALLFCRSSLQCCPYQDQSGNRKMLWCPKETFLLHVFGGFLRYTPSKIGDMFIACSILHNIARHGLQEEIEDTTVEDDIPTTAVETGHRGNEARQNLFQTIFQGEVTIHYNKLQADPKQGKSLDIVLKKVKHRLVENMSSGTADALGLSRAILCNDGLVKKLEELEKTAEFYRGMMEHTKRLLRTFFELSQTHRGLNILLRIHRPTFGDVFSVIGVREPQPAASEAFVKFADAHRSIEKFGIGLLKTIKPMLSDLNTYLNKAIPDTKLTIRKYLDVKFEYLSYCLKVKEMDDEEYSSIALGEPLYRVSTGNYEYRLILRCRQEARSRFARMRKDVLEKIELLDQKHVQDTVFQLQRFVSAISKYDDQCFAVLKEADIFPIEVDLARTTLSYGQNDAIPDEAEDEEEMEKMTEAENGEKLIDDP